MAHQDRIVEKVTFKDAGLSADGKKLFIPEQAFAVPPVVEPKDHKDNQHGEMRATHDELYIVRPATG